jgi:Tol biopolymer transport system component
VAVVDRQGRARRLAREQPGVDGIAWAPDGRALLYGVLAGNVGEVRAVDLDGRERSVVRAPDELYVLDAAADGRVLVKRQSGRTHIFAHAPDAAGDVDVSLFDMDFPHDLSADGRRLAFDEAGAIAGDEYRVYLRPTDGAPALDLGEGRAPKLSPDGAWVVVASISDRRRLTLLPVGAGAPRELAAGATTARWTPSFVPDGTQVIFAGEEGDGVTRLYLQSVAGGPPRRVGPVGIDLPRSMPRPVAPDGKRVVGVDGERRKLLVALDGDEPPRPLPGLAADDDLLAWTPDGDELYVAPHRQPVDVVLVSVATGARRPFRRLGPDVSHGQSTYRPLVSSDGKSWAYAVLRESSALFLVRP